MERDDISEKSIKAVIFDIGGVLQLGGKPRLNPKNVHSSGVHEYIANKLRITIDQYFDSIDTIYAKSIEGIVTKSVVLGVLSCNLNYPKEKLEKLYHKSYKRRYKRNNKLFKIAKQLKKQGYKIGILSDQWHLSKDVFAKEKDMKIFDEVVISCDVGVRKPRKEAYDMILEKLGVCPKEAIFIDNQIWNLIPAHKMGIKTILYIDNKKTIEQLRKFGIYVK